MKNFLLTGSFFLAFCVLPILSYSQGKDSLENGIVKGLLEDSVHNHVIKQATVAIYSELDDSLIDYSLTNNFGAFEIGKLPLKKPLYLVVSFEGYATRRIKFILNEPNVVFDLKEVYMPRNSSETSILLEEVKITRIAPISVRGDTLEFNADAFKLDPNAVVEDLMRRLPGITIWNDGVITINGRKVNQLLVEGKPFFGGKTKTALQNLPKTSVDKIQVYRTEPNDNNIDSLINVNIKLKSDKQIGSFGKLALGFGTRDRGSMDVMANAFNRKTQISILGTSNNVNNDPADFNSLIQKNSFKGVGSSIDYQPDFFSAGVKRSLALGGMLQHDFIDNPRHDLNNRLTVNYFLSKNREEIKEDLTNSTNIGDNTHLISEMLRHYKTNRITHDYLFDYNNRNRNLEFFFTPSLSINKGITDDKSSSSIAFNYSPNVSTNLNSTTNVFNEKNVSVFTGIKVQQAKHRIFNNIDLDFKFQNTHSENDRNMKTEYLFLDTAIESRRFSRNYLNSSKVLVNSINLNIKRLNDLFWDNSKVWGIALGIRNSILMSNKNDVQTVFDIDTLNQRKTNSDLTNTWKSNIISYFPSMDISRNIVKHRMDRFEKIWRFQASIQGQISNQISSSDKRFQNFDRTYKHTFFNSSAIYDDHRYGTFQKKYKIEYRSRAELPDVSQIAPLVDSISLYSLAVGNSSLKEEYIQSLSFSYDYNSLKSSNNRSLAFSVTAINISDKIADSISYYESGRRVVSTMNVDGYRSLRTDFVFQQALELGIENNLQLTATSNLNFIRSPYFINHEKSLSEIKILFASGNVHYNYKSKLAINLQHTYSDYKSRQNAMSFTNVENKTMLSGNYLFTKKMSVASNISYVSNKNNIVQSSSVVIWNVSLSARFLRGENFEIKFSALDLLRENSNIVSYGYENNYTAGYRNSLQNYFMVTLSYYPRLFGKKSHSIDDK